MLLNPKKWTDWRSEEKEISEKYLSSLTKSLENKSEVFIKRFLNKSYLLRDLSIAFLEKNNNQINSDMVDKINKSLQIISKTKYNFKPMVLNSLKLWQYDNQVMAYRTPKSILYSVRDY